VLRKLLAAGPKGWWLLLQAQLAIVEAALLVRFRSEGALMRDLATIRAAPSLAASDDARVVDATGLAIDRVARIGLGRPLCLVRSLALQRLLLRKGVSGSSIQVGVRMRSRGLQAHAWVEWRGRVVGEDPEFVRSFRPFLDFGSAWPGSVSWT
jgi:hypothetical protein